MDALHLDYGIYVYVYVYVIQHTLVYTEPQ